MLHLAAVGLAGVLGESAGLHPGGDLVLTIRAIRVAGGFQADEAFAARA